MTEAYTVIPLSPMRKIIAARMSEAKRTIPHFRLVADIELDEILELRNESQKHDPDTKLSVNDFLIKACATALTDTPAVNVQLVEDAIYWYRTADIAVVTAVEGGLSTPIVHRANEKSVWEISREMKDLAARALRGALKMDEIVGGSFSLSNLGMYGVDQFDAIINPPQCAILAVGAAKARVVLSPQRKTRVATVLRVTLSCDHRAIDGAAGAAFLSALRHCLEEPGDLYEDKGNGHFNV